MEVGDDDDEDGDDGVEEEVFGYFELQDLCDVLPPETSCEHYHRQHVVALDDDENTDDYDGYDEE